MAEGRIKLTGDGTHRATQRGYAKGEVIEEGKPVPSGVPVSDKWMERTKGDTAEARAVEDVLKPHKEDPDLTKLAKPALQALATNAGVTNVEGLTRENLIAAIKAQHEPQAQ